MARLLRPKSQRVERMIAAMSRSIGGKALPSVLQIARKKRDPFRVLVATVISLRTKDEVTMEASRKLFAIADTPKKLGALGIRVIEKAIYPAGFYKTKARALKNMARRIISDYNGAVPDSIDELLSFKGVGRKTATLVVSLGYGKDAICVDTHVHRVSNRLGIVETSNPTDTEFALMDVLPRKRWIGYNELLVSFGQQVCTPISPRCRACDVRRMCARVGVTTHR